MLTSSGQPSIEDEVARLREELQQSQRKFETWKAKAKVGVDELRNRVLELTSSLEHSETERKALLAKQGEATHSPTIPNTSGEMKSTVNASFLTRTTMLSWAEAQCDACVDTSAAKADAVLQAALAYGSLVTSGAHISASASSPTTVDGTPPGGSEELETYKRRTAMTLRLQAKNVETLQKQNEELNKALQQVRDELKERDRALLGRDEVIGTLEQRLDTLERAKNQLEQEQASMLQGPNMEQVNFLEAQMEREVQNLRAEFAAREESIFIQHNDEIERLVTRHEEELIALRREADEQVAEAIENAVAMQSAGATGTGVANGTQIPEAHDDTAYMELLGEYEKLKKQHRSLTDAFTKLQRESQDRRHTAVVSLPTSPPSLNSGGAGGGRGALIGSNEQALAMGASGGDVDTKSQSQPASLPEAIAIINDLRSTLQSLSEQLWAAKKTLLDSKHKQPQGPPAGALDQQQVAYLKSIVVTLLCSKSGDTDMRMKLLPILSTLLHFDSKDLTHIYEANPKWINAK